MTCICKQKEPKHKTSPVEHCPACAEKHLCTAYALAAGDGTLTVQAVAGELECARLHTEKEGPLYRGIAAAETSVLCRTISLPELAGLSLAGQEAQSGTNSTRLVRHKKINPLLGELLMSAAWRLSLEPGYWRENRPLVIGYLAMAQGHLTEFSKRLADACRRLRHSIQAAPTPLDNGIWLEPLHLLDDIMTPIVIQDVEDKYGNDLSIYFGK